ncbi:MAG: ADP-heptose--LPS heptosyltransferase [Planctomycetota bacterium]|nr:MAG: ADP-heptose--LPS heptosyltransferase [Planctomycetota bacterium]
MRTRALIHLDALIGLPLCGMAYALSLPGRALRRLNRGRRAPASRTTVVPHAQQRILIVKFLGMGSMLLATPLLRRLRRAYPQAHVTFLTFEANASLVRRLPGVDDVLAVPTGSLPRLLAHVPALLWRLRRQRFDLAFDLEFYSRLSNLVSWGSGARRRVGFFVRARWRGSLLTDPVYFNSTLPYGEAVVALLRPLGLNDAGPLGPLDAPQLSEQEQADARAQLLTHGVPEEGTLVAINVNASDLCEERRWPPERFAKLVERFGREVANVDRFVFLGAASETDVVRDVLNRVSAEVLPRCLDLSGRTSLVELSALLSRAALLISNDSGPLHLAAALRVPTISFYGPETPQLYGPVGDRHLVFYSGHWCSPCLSVYNAKIAMCDGENECMRRIQLDDVVQQSARFCREVVGLAPVHPRASLADESADGGTADEDAAREAER